jgi:hypothetical protein
VAPAPSNKFKILDHGCHIFLRWRVNQMTRPSRVV